MVLLHKKQQMFIIFPEIVLLNELGPNLPVAILASSILVCHSMHHPATESTYEFVRVSLFFFFFFLIFIYVVSTKHIIGVFVYHPRIGLIIL
jgi:hypothetical protein